MSNVFFTDNHIILIEEKLTLYKREENASTLEECTKLYETTDFSYNREVVGTEVVKHAGVCLHEGPYAFSQQVELKEFLVECELFTFTRDEDLNKSLTWKGVEFRPCNLLLSAHNLTIHISRKDYEFGEGSMSGTYIVPNKNILAVGNGYVPGRGWKKFGEVVYPKGEPIWTDHNKKVDGYVVVNNL